MANKSIHIINSAYFKYFREKMGFSNQSSAKEFLAGKDINPNIDFAYIKDLNTRIEAIIDKIHETIHPSARYNPIKSFADKYIHTPYRIIADANVLVRLNNQGRRPEEVLFSWLRGYAVAEYFTPAISTIFSVNVSSIAQIGEDDLKNIETFRRSPKADLEIAYLKHKVRIEVQCGFQGINDINEHKVREAKSVFAHHQIPTLCIHIDLFNGQVAFVRLDNIPDNDHNWVTRQQMEGQTVLAIDQNHFKWRLLDAPPTLSTLEVGLS